MSKEESIELENTEEQENEIEKASKGIAYAVADEIKGRVDKAAQLIDDASKGVADFAGVQLKNAKIIFGKVSKNIGDSLSKQRLQKYRPVFLEGLDQGSFNYPPMINVVEYDKRMEIEECRGAIGYQEKLNNVEILGVYKDDMEKFNITYFPEKTETVYYVHPLDKHVYLEIKEYFPYLQKARVAELENIAQSLGAKHFKVTILEESRSEQISKNNGGAKIGFGKDKAGVNVEYLSHGKKYNYLGVAAENYFPGKAPVRPKLEFWAHDTSITSLVEQRMNPDNPLLSKTFSLDYNTSSGIKEKEAAKIDGVLKTLKFSGSGSISEEVKNESRKRFEYTIEF